MSEQDGSYALAEELALSKFWVKPETPFPYPFIHEVEKIISPSTLSLPVGAAVAVEKVNNHSFQDIVGWFDLELEKQLSETAESIRPTLVEIIERDESMEQLQSDLMDLIGVEHWALLEGIVERREALRLAFKEQKKQKTVKQSKTSLTSIHSSSLNNRKKE